MAGSKTFGIFYVFASFKNVGMKIENCDSNVPCEVCILRTNEFYLRGRQTIFVHVEPLVLRFFRLSCVWLRI